MPNSEPLSPSARAPSTKHCTKLASGHLKARGKCKGRLPESASPSSRTRELVLSLEISFNPFEISGRTRSGYHSLPGESDPGSRKTTWFRTPVFSARRGGPHRQGSAKSPGARLGAQRGPAGAASARPPARSGGVEARVAQPALQRELSAALGSLCSQQRRLRHSVETETSGGDARTGSDRRAAEPGSRVGSGDRAGWRMGSPRGVGQGPTPIPHGDPAAREAAEPGALRPAGAAAEAWN